MNKNISNEQIKKIEDIISKKKNNMDVALGYYIIIWVDEEEKAAFNDTIPYTKFKEPTYRFQFIKKWHNNFTAMALLDYYVAKLEYEEAIELKSIIIGQ